MKLKICLALLLFSFLGNSQTKKPGFIFFETGVTRLWSSSAYLGTYVDYYKIPKELFGMVPLPKNSSNSIFKNDTLIFNRDSYNSISNGSTDFRTISIGFGKTIRYKNKIRVDHAIGFQYSLADFSIGTLAVSYVEKQNTFIDTSGHSKTAFITSTSEVTGYGKMRSAGITYQNTITLKPIRRVDLSCAIRQSLLLKMEDKLMLFQSERHDTSDYLQYNYAMDCSGAGIGVIFNSINFYTRELPPSNNYKTYKGKIGLQYQMTLLARISLNLGKKYGTKFYTQFGASIFSFYGNQFKTSSAINYGIGILQDLN